MARFATIATAVLAMFCCAPAFATTQSWNITEVDPDNGAQGQWLVTVEGGKLTGSTNMQFDTGAPLSYTLDGSITGGALTVNMLDRSDGKKGCVVSGHILTNSDNKSHRIVGETHCSNDEKFLLRGGYF